MRKLLLFKSLLAMLVVISLVLSGCGSPASVPSPSTPKAESKEPYKIGLLTTLSGSLSASGIEIRDAAQMEVDLINTNGGINGHPIELIVEDDGMDPGKAVTALNKLVQQDKVLAITGIKAGAMEAAVRPVAERNLVPIIFINPTTPVQRARKDQYSFNLSPNEFAKVSYWIEILKAKGYTKVAGISANDSIAQSTLDQLKKDGVAQGITVDILSDFLDMKAVDLTPQVAKLKELVAKNKSQVLVTTCWTTNLSALLKTMKQMGVDIPVIGYDVMANNAVLNMGGEELNGFMTPGGRALAGDALADSDPQKAVIVDFKKRYEAKTGKVVSVMPAGAYDGLHIIMNALKSAGADKAKLRDAIEKTKNYVGVTAIYNFSADDHEGTTKDSFVFYQIKDKKFVYMKDIK